MSSSFGQFVWFECLNRDNPATLAFYSQVVGWKVENWEGPFAYSMFATSAGPIAGCNALADDPAGAKSPAAWMAYLGTENADADAKRVVELGGSVIDGPIDIPNVGRMYVVADPAGAVFSLHQSPTPYTPAAKSLGRIAWHELLTSDLNSTWAFYEALFGWKKTMSIDMGAAGSYQMFANGGESNAGGMMKGDPTWGPPRWRVYASVANVADALGMAKSLGATVRSGPNQVQGGDIVAVLVDPGGIEFALVQHAGGTA